jgi:hypothetical protein
MGNTIKHRQKNMHEETILERILSWKSIINQAFFQSTKSASAKYQKKETGIRYLSNISLTKIHSKPTLYILILVQKMSVLYFIMIYNLIEWYKNAKTCRDLHKKHIGSNKNYHKNFMTYFELSQELRDIWKVGYEFFAGALCLQFCIINR